MMLITKPIDAYGFDSIYQLWDSSTVEYGQSRKIRRHEAASGGKTPRPKDKRDHDDL